MRIYMQTTAAPDRPPRYYHLHLQQDLLEGWNLVKEGGFQGASVRVVREHFDSREQAIQAMLKVRDSQIQRGYQVMFAQGDTFGGEGA